MRSGTWTYFGVVHWDDGRDLDELDSVARRGAADELAAALAAGLFCQLVTVQCRACGDNHLVAVPDPGMPVVTGERTGGHRLASSCPTCGDGRFARYAEVFPGG